MPLSIAYLTLSSALFYVQSLENHLKFFSYSFSSITISNTPNQRNPQTQLSNTPESPPPHPSLTPHQRNTPPKSTKKSHPRDLFPFSMDPIKKEKHRAVRKYKRARFVQNLFQYCLTAYVFGLFLSKAFPSLFRALKYFICVSLPNIGASLVGPKCLFLLCNMILIFLAHESKLFRSPPSSPTPEIQDEYVKFSRRPRRPSTIEEKEERKMEVSLVEESVEMIGQVVEEDKKDEEEEQEKEEERKEEAEQEEQEAQAEEQEEEEAKGGVDVGGKEEHELPADELNRRFEDFIQRVNKQRRLEVQMMECGG